MYNMFLHDNLRICLLALASRYPTNLIESNGAILSDHTFCPGCRTALDTLKWLQRADPALLEERATLIINAQKCEIFLPNYNEQRPAYWIHCRGRLPQHSEKRYAEKRYPECECV
jgi:hypothetical protein